MIPKVDTHQHLWDLDILRLPWLSGAGVAAINRSFVMEDYLEATAEANVVRSVYMEVNTDPALHAVEARYAIDLCRDEDNPMSGAVVGGAPGSSGFRAYLDRLADEPEVKGVRTVLHDADRPKGMCLAPTFVESIRLLGELGLSFDLCMRPDEIGDGAELAGACPGTMFMVDHCGNMPVVGGTAAAREAWQGGMQRAADLENVYCKISGIVITAGANWRGEDLAENMDFCMETFGEDRIVFGGDWPVCLLGASYVQWAEALEEITSRRSETFRRKLFHDNAVTFYRLS
ncbi:MAG: amidohydrolase [Planctomycetaceae bacterium]|nr:amidohydrolase [Planctomycetaceae bacterium]